MGGPASLHGVVLIFLIDSETKHVAKRDCRLDIGKNELCRKYEVPYTRSDSEHKLKTLVLFENDIHEAPPEER